MDKSQAEKFLKKLFAEIWEHNNPELLQKYYAKDLVAHYGKITFGLREVENRLHYLGKRYSGFKYFIDDLIIPNKNIIVVRNRQIGHDKYLQQPFQIYLTTIYRLENNLIQEFWLSTNEQLDYFATAADLNPEKLQQEKITVEDHAKRRFLELLADYQYLYHREHIELTQREQECLYYFLNGYTAKEIAKKLNLSFRTVESYLDNLKQKYGCSFKHELRQKIFPSEPLV